MSPVSTPAQSDVLSASSTPVKGVDGTQLDQLTPRSKIKALLAALDSSDDDKLPESTSNVPGDARARLAQTLKTDSNKTVGGHGKGSSNVNDEWSEGSEGSGDEDDMVAPRGKLASRLYGQRPTKQDLHHDTAEAGAASTSDQTQRNLPQKPHSFIKESVEEVTSDQSEKGNGITRKFLKRRKRPFAIDSASSQSRSKSPPSQRSSPALFLTPKKPSASDGISNNEPLPGFLLTPNLGRSSTPRKSISGSHGSDSDLPSDPNANSRFLALVARKREEREAREAAERRKKQEKSSRLEVDTRQSVGKDEINRMGISEDDSENEAVGGRKLTQQSRPTRKASKKALEEMKRETQRMSRNMQLAHQAKTKKKITKESLLARFNFGGGQNTTTNVVEALSSSMVGSSTHVSDIEEAKEQETPPTSPILPLGNEYSKAGVAKDVQPIESPVDELHDEVGDELPSTEDIMTHSLKRLNKGKGKAMEEPTQDTIINPNKIDKQNKTRRPIKIRLPNPSDRQKGQQSDSESDLEIIPTNKLKSKQRDIFDRLPTQKVAQTRSLQTLRALAHLTSPSKQKSNSRIASITPVEMQASLQKLARQQAARERAEKIQDLKDRGVIIHTAEEIERDQGDLQDLLEKARKDAEQITKKEKDAAKKERRDNGETVLDDSSDDEEEYREEKATISEVEFSGSEDEEEDGEEENEDEEDEELSGEEDEEGIEGVILTKNKRGVENLIDNEAPEHSQEEDEEDDDDDDDDGDGDRDAENFVGQKKRRNKVSRVIDEEDEEDDLQQDSNYTDPPQNPFIPNLHECIDAPMGLTQAFAATMADSQTQSGGIMGVDDEEQDSLAFLRGMPEVDFPMIDADEGESMVINSQPNQFSLRDTSPHESGNTEINLHLTQSQIDHESIPEATEYFEFATQYSQIPDPTQDVGFGLFSPIANRFVSVPPSTIETVVLPKANVNEAIVKKKGRLRRRLEAAPVLSNVDDENIPSGLKQNDFTISANAFDVLKKASKKDLLRDESFNKDKSNAKGMVEEQAEESEDEYAGLGGASDDESGNEEDEEVRKMMDDGDVKLDERKLAAFHANKERVSDEKAVEKLFKDINNGMLRKKRGAEFDLSDSDDDIEARRKAKRRQFTKMRKALLENENVGKIAEDPKKLAFLRAIEDREDDDDLDFLQQPEEPSQPDSITQEDSQSQDVPPISTDTIGMKRKRPLQESLPDAANRPPPHARRIQKIKRPSSLAEIRASVSFLIEEPNALPQHPYSDSSDDEAAHPQEPSTDLQKDLPNPRRNTTQPIIDRLVLKRTESASAAASSTTSNHRLAFLNPNTSHTEAPGFKVPTLLRRATTQNLDSANAYGITTATATAATATAIVGTERAAGGGESTGVRKGGSKRSSVNWFSREEERRRVLEGKGKAGREKGGGRNRRGVVGGLGGLVGGVFE